MKKTFKELQDLDQIVGSMYQADEKLKETKFGYAYKRFCDKNYIPVIKEYNDAIADARLDHALENETTKEVITDQTNYRGFKYSKEGLKKVIEAERKLKLEWDGRELEITPYVSAYLPEDLTEEQKEALTGCLI